MKRLHAVETLSENPFSVQFKKLQGSESSYRILVTIIATLLFLPSLSLADVERIFRENSKKAILLTPYPLIC